MARAFSPAIDSELDLLSRALADAAHQVGLLRMQTTFFDQGEDPENRAHAVQVAASLDEALERVAAVQKRLSEAIPFYENA